MTLFWHNHFATAYSKVSGALGAEEGARYMAATSSEDPNQVKGQIELFREFALGNFRDLLIAVAKDTAMLVWLDGRTNVKGKPQENFARELMELFTMGVDTFAETDVYAGARVFTGWNLARPQNAYYTFSYVAGQHDTTAKEFTFPIYSNGSKVIPARAQDAGMQDGLDLINAVAAHPATGPRLARKLYQFFISEVSEPDQGVIADLANTYYSSKFEMRPVMEKLLLSSQFTAAENRYARYSWPAEFVARAIKEVGWQGLSLDKVRSPLANMGQLLFEPPNVGGWPVGAGWFSTGTMLARSNFAATLAASQKETLAVALESDGFTPQALLAAMLDRVTPAPFDAPPQQALMSYLVAGGNWTGSAAQLNTRAAGLARLLVGSSEYQLV
jgi:uncharacterized protein (DUF1800 family)